MKEIPLVSICCLTYNHEPFIRQCLEGFLMQKCDFNFEILIYDDASTDKTADIIREFELKYPNIVKPIYQTENQYSKGVKPTFKYNFPRVSGKYIAICEGDDYWTDPYRLQKQVDFLEENDEYGLVCGGFTSINVSTGEKNTWLKDITDKNSKFSFGFDIEVERFWKDWCIQTLTILYRSSLYNAKEFAEYNYKHSMDIHLYYHIIKQKKGFYFKEILGSMNVLPTGIYSHKSTLEKRAMLYHARKEISKKHKDDKILKSMFFSVTSELFVNKQFVSQKKDLNRLTLFKDMFFSMQNLNDFKHLINCIFKSNQISQLYK